MVRWIGTHTKLVDGVGIVADGGAAAGEVDAGKVEGGDVGEGDGDEEEEDEGAEEEDDAGDVERAGHRGRVVREDEMEIYCV